jgi:hypothetical protein
MENNSTTLVAKSGSTTASKLLESEEYSDLTIVCQRRQFKVHKAILCPQSDVISKLCDIDMLEKRTGLIEHEEFDADTVERMINFAYKKKYNATRRPRYEPAQEVEESIADMDSLAIEDTTTTGGVALPQEDADATTPNATTLDEEPAELSTADKGVIHARVHGLAEYYDMPELRDHAYSQFMSVADHELEDSDLEGFDKVAREVCKTTVRQDGSAGYSYDSPLRSGFLSLVARYAPKLALDANFSAALCEPDLQDSSADFFNVLAKRITDLEVGRDEKIAILEAEKAKLHRLVATVNADSESQLFVANNGRQMVEAQLEHKEGVMQRLITSLRELPESCPNSHCSNEWASLTFEEKGNGEWQVRCGSRRCRARLN